MIPDPSLSRTFLQDGKDPSCREQEELNMLRHQKAQHANMGYIKCNPWVQNKMQLFYLDGSFLHQLPKSSKSGKQRVLIDRVVAAILVFFRLYWGQRKIFLLLSSYTERIGTFVSDREWETYQLGRFSAHISSKSSLIYKGTRNNMDVEIG